MIRDSTPHRIFNISELTRLVATYLVYVNPKGAVNLACACRCLEEPALSTLWETQWSLCTLLRVLPEKTWNSEHPRGEQVIRVVEEPSPEDWDRVRRYASWMRRVCVDERSDLVEETFQKFRLNSPPGGWFPALQDLSWRIMGSNLPYVDLFFSPYLKRISIYTPWTWAGVQVPPNVLAAIASAVSKLPASSALEFLSLDFDCAAPPGYFKDSLSSVILRCGPSLVEFTSSVPLSDAAINHLIQLPHLRTWRTEGPPPSYSTLPLSLPSLPLAKLTLAKGAARGWLSLFRRLEDSTPTAQGVTPPPKLKKSLKSLDVKDPSGFTIDIPFTSSVQIFRNLVTLGVTTLCPGKGEEGQCAFRLNNDNVTELAMALPQLETLSLGRPCSGNTCATTVACLLPISVHCIKLQRLRIHFNTANIVDDIENVSKDPRFLELHSLPKCALLYLFVDRMPLTIDKSGFKTVADGIINIFPSLDYCSGLERPWDKLSKTIGKFR